MPRMIPLRDWAKKEFGKQSPRPQTLFLYARRGMIDPVAVKVGRRWMVDKDARFIGEVARPVVPRNTHPKLKGIIGNGSQNRCA